MRALVLFVSLLLAGSVSGQGDYITAPYYAPDCPPGYIENSWGECVHDPDYWELVKPIAFFDTITGVDSCLVTIRTGGWVRRADKWTISVVDRCDTVPDGFVETQLLAPTDPYDTIGVVRILPYIPPGRDTVRNYLVQTYRVRCRPDTLWSVKE